MNELKLIPIEELPTNTFDLLVFVYDGKASDGDTNNLIFVVRDVNSTTAVNQMSDMEMYAGFMINGAVQLSREQTHYKDTSLMAPTRYLVSTDEGWMWLHDIPVWDLDKWVADHEDGDDGSEPSDPAGQDFSDNDGKDGLDV